MKPQTCSLSVRRDWMFDGSMYGYVPLEEQESLSASNHSRNAASLSSAKEGCQGYSLTWSLLLTTFLFSVAGLVSLGLGASTPKAALLQPLTGVQANYVPGH